MARAFNAQAARRPVFDALIDAAQTAGWKKPILEDQDRKPLSYLDLVRAAFALGAKIADRTAPGERVGVLLPTGAGVAVTFFALHAFGRIPVMLNFTAGLKNVRGACEVAGVKRVLCARRFVEQAGLQPLLDPLSQDVEVVWLEDVRAAIGTPARLRAAASGAAPRLFRAKLDPDAPGVILFTSGSFGTPKGVVLTHANLTANVEQIAAHIDLDRDWVFFNALPAFHCFGLTAGVLLPLLVGSKAFLYPSPLHVKQIPPLVKDSGAAVMFGTDTFVNQYARAARPEELSGLKFIVCGAEKVRDETHQVYREKFGGVEVVEGYGATEAAPVIAVNKPEDNRPGTVGQLLPAMETRLEPVEGIPEGGRLFVRGPNVMAGYITEAGRPPEPLPGGWHDTGDVVSIGEDRVVTILGRVKRFAKIGGEMVSLTAVEDIVASLWPDRRHAVVSTPDPKKGERLVLVTDHEGADTGQIAAHARAQGVPELVVPKKILKVAEVPLLGTGKTDYAAIQKMAETEAEAA
jgi:acyl-[acyl-carrier-protein]-phospholipid O-acyltransferase / long-chain-fatty-acid--[acyl-carrier-protein] ligase